MGARISDAVWSRFLKGDKGIFVRLLSGKSFTDTRDRVRDKFKNDEEFRRYVLEYLSEFEGILNQSKRIDRSDVLESVFLSADVGKLYLLLKRSLDEEGS